MFLGVLGTPFHVGADSGRRRIEHVDLVALDDRPPAILVREVWDALVDDAGGAVAQRRVDNVAVSGHPADVRGAPIDRVGLDIEDVVVGRCRADQVSGSGVDDALGLGGGAAGIEQVE